MELVNGAEAIVSRKDDTLIKRRVPKTYRHPALDEKLRKARARREKKLLEKASTIIAVPKVHFGDDETIVMDFIDGVQVKEALDTNVGLARKIGLSLGRLHKNNIIHGDVTTSNCLVDTRGEVFFIDFGLGFSSKKAEDKAVDIHVFKESLESKHHKVLTKAYEEFLKGYEQENPQEEVFSRLKGVERRGRNKAKK